MIFVFFCLIGIQCGTKAFTISTRPLIAYLHILHSEDELYYLPSCYTYWQRQNKILLPFYDYNIWDDIFLYIYMLIVLSCCVWLFIYKYALYML